MKPLPLAIIFITLFLAVRLLMWAAWSLGKIEGRDDSKAAISTLQSHLDHERQYTARLSQILAAKEAENQLKGLEP